MANDYIIALIHHFYHQDPVKMTYQNFTAYVNQLPRIRKVEAGIDPDEKKMTNDEFLEKLKAGEITPDFFKPKLKKMSVQEKLAEELKIKKLLGNENEQKTVLERM